jgi:hypothetical protein
VCGAEIVLTAIFEMIGINMKQVNRFNNNSSRLMG